MSVISLFETSKKLIEKLKEVHRSQYLITEFDVKQRSKLVLFIISLMIVSQLAITIYVPSMPNMAFYFNTDDAHIQLTLTLYLIGYGFSQFIYGPLSDILGRRIVLLVGLTIFIIASLISVFATSISVLLFARIFHGIGIGCGDTMGRAILCDRFRDVEFIKAACRIGLASTVTPLLAPILGGYLETWIGWRINFVIILLYGFVVMMMVLFYFPETKPQDNLYKTTFLNILNNYRYILTNRIFLAFFIPGLVCFMGETAYYMLSPFIIQYQLNWTPSEYGWTSIFVVIGLLSGTLIANSLSHRKSYHYLVLHGLYLLGIGSILMLVCNGFPHLNIIYIVMPMVIFMMGVGLTYPNTNLGALTPFTATAGTAGALQGGLQMLLGGALSSFLGLISHQTQFCLSMVLTGLSLFGVLSFVLLVRLPYG